jgi:hypothetical protein
MQVEDKKQQKQGSTWFGEYIISACWQKMEQRIGGQGQPAELTEIGVASKQ